jgi:hypothetical protein
MFDLSYHAPTTISHVRSFISKVQRHVRCVQSSIDEEASTYNFDARMQAEAAIINRKKPDNQPFIRAEAQECSRMFQCQQNSTLHTGRQKLSEQDEFIKQARTGALFQRIGFLESVELNKECVNQMEQMVSFCFFRNFLH